MSHHRLILAYGPLFTFWLADYYIKFWFASHIHTNYNFGAIFLSYYENHGIIMGALFNLPSVLKIVSLSTIGGVIIFSFPILMSLVHFRSKKVILGLSLVLAGIIGNVTDRIVYGFVIDYIYLKTQAFTTPVFNLADAIQWVGYILLSLGLFQEMSHHFPDNDQRSNGWINRSYQLQFSLTLLSIFLLVGLTFIVFSYTFIKFSLLEFGVVSAQLSAQYLEIYLNTSLVLLSFLSLIVLLIGKILSHRIAGPVHAITRYINDTKVGKNYPLKLRSQDHLKELEKPLTQLNNDFSTFKKNLDKET